VVPYDEIESASVGKRRRSIEIRAKSAAAFAKIPLPAGDLTEFKAKIERKDRKEADLWEAEATLRIAQALPGTELLE